MVDPNGFLMIEPVGCNEPLIYTLTRKATAVFNRNVEKDKEIAYRGFHICSCGAVSNNTPWWLTFRGKKLETNSLAVHYVACHRDELPEADVKIINSFPYEDEPTEEQLGGWRAKRNRTEILREAGR